MSAIRVLQLSRASGAGLAAVGVLWGGIAASMPDIKAQVGASDAQLGGALLMSAVGGMIAMAMAPRIGQLLGRFSILILSLVVAVAILLPIFAYDVFSLAAAWFVLGVSVAALDILTNVEVSARESKYGLHLMGFNHAMFSFAFAGAAYGVSLGRQAGLGLAEILPWLSVIGICLAALSYMPQSAQEPAAKDAPKARPAWFAVILTGIILFSAFIGENATEAWSALHIERTLGAAPGEGGLGPAMLGLVMGLGRLVGQAVAERLGHARLIFVSACFGMAGALTLAFAATPAIAIMGVSISALGMAVIVPSVMSILGAKVTESERAVALSRAWMLGIVGFFIGPAMMGGIAELYGLRMAFVAVCVVVAIILPAILALSRHRTHG